MKRQVFILVSIVVLRVMSFAADKVTYSIPHIPAEQDYWQCYLLVDNLENKNIDYKITLYNESGLEIQNSSFSIQAFNHVEQNLYTLNSNAINGSVEVEIDSKIIFYVIYKNIYDGGIAKIILQKSESPTIAFNFENFQEDMTWKGIALTNPNSTDTTINFRAYNQNLEEIGNIQKSISKHGHISFVLNGENGFGTSFDWQNCVRVYAISTSSIIGVNMSGVNSEKLLFGLSEKANTIPESTGGVVTGDYKIIAWNDLGMHCYDDDYSIFTILPPYNTLWAQVIKTGATPEIVTNDVTVSYSFENNSTSAQKTNFWDYEQDLFGVNLAVDTGLKGKTLSDNMDVDNDHFIAEGIPLTQYNDDMSVNYYQTAIVTAKNKQGQIIAQTRTVAPVSNEMHCNNCHNDNGIGGIATGNYRTNILTLHDSKEGTHLMNQKPILCASCHTSNALGIQGSEDHLSRVIHKKHAGLVQAGTEGCYNCHPGPDTKCLRGVMFQKGMQCTDCHGSMSDVASKNRNPWFDEPNCGDCHGYGTPQGELYRMSTGHGGVYCSACHGSPHAILPSSNPVDNQQPILLQGKPGILSDCAICHTDGRTGDNPHATSPHPDDWYKTHRDYAEHNGYTSCAQCHGSDYRGGTSGVSCYQCHDGPTGDD